MSVPSVSEKRAARSANDALSNARRESINVPAGCTEGMRIDT
jgi:hypothetical protein